MDTMFAFGYDDVNNGKRLNNQYTMSFQWKKAEIDIGDGYFGKSMQHEFWFLFGLILQNKM